MSEAELLKEPEKVRLKPLNSNIIDFASLKGKYPLKKLEIKKSDSDMTQ